MPHSPPIVCATPRRLGTRLLCLSLLAWSASGCVSVEGNIPEVVLTRHSLAIEASPLPPQAGELSHTLTFDHPYDSFNVPDQVQSELRPVRGWVTAITGVADLSFVRSVSLVMAVRDRSLPPAVEVLAYEREDGQPVGIEIGSEAVNQPNVVEYWETGATKYNLTVSGMLPQQPWTIDVSIELSGKVKVAL